MIDFMKAMVRLINAAELVDGRFHIRITLDIKDSDGSQILVNQPIT